MERALALMARADDSARARRAIRVRGAVDGVDVQDGGSTTGQLEDEDAAFEVPGHLFEAGGRGGRLGEEVVGADEGADAVEFAAGGAGVVGVGREAEVRGVGGSVVVVGGWVHGLGGGGEGFGVVGCDF